MNKEAINLQIEKCLQESRTSNFSRSKKLYMNVLWKITSAF